MLILKSASPRRKMILENLELKFQIRPSSIDETWISGEDPLKYLERVTLHKLEVEKEDNRNTLVSADTIVVILDKILGKPATKEEAIEMLSELSGRTHSVYSGFAIFKAGSTIFDYEETKVRFKPLNQEAILNYIEMSNPFDKAGAYGIQDEPSPVADYKGSLTNVVGFPLRKFMKWRDLWMEFL